MDWIRNALEKVLVTAQKIFTIIIMLFITIKNTKRGCFKKWGKQPGPVPVILLAETSDHYGNTGYVVSSPDILVRLLTSPFSPSF